MMASGFWNAVSVDQFGEQTVIRIDKEALNGMTLSADVVSGWIITVHLSDHVYFDNTPGQTSEKHRRTPMPVTRKTDSVVVNIADSIMT